MPNQGKTPLAVTVGEPAGIGPELITRIWQERVSLNLPYFVCFGAIEAIEAHAPDLPVRKLDDLTDIPADATEYLPVIDTPLTEPLMIGELNPANGGSVIKSIDLAVEATLKGKTSAVVTAPIHKAALYSSGFDAPGHTEYLARLCDLPDNHSIMMLATTGLRVIPVTVHVPLADVAKQLTADRIIHAGMIAAMDLRDRFGIKKPRLAVAGLNPHAGEDGTIGMEEGTHIMPAIWALRDQGVEVSDPAPADTLFHEEARANYDAVLCMYHDQALIPLKTLDFWGGVNITLGLPIVRTSPDHGTALSLAGKNEARLDSMIAALRTASEMTSRNTRS